MKVAICAKDSSNSNGSTQQKEEMYVKERHRKEIATHREKGSTARLQGGAGNCLWRTGRRKA